MTDFQARASQQGQAFEDQAVIVLESLGYVILGRNVVDDDLGIEVVVELRGPDGTVYWAEFKGSWAGRQPGLRRTDTVKKALANAFLANAAGDRPPMIILTSHLPEPGTRGETMLRVALQAGAITGVFNINDPTDQARLNDLPMLDSH